MRFLWYFFAFVCGTLGLLSTLRSLERMIYGGGSGSMAMQAMFGLGFVMLAIQAWRKARADALPRSRT